MIQLQQYGQAHNQPPLIAIPGLDGAIGSIEPVVHRLAQHREVIVVDFSAERNQTLEMLVAEIAAVLASQQYPALDIMGQSIGTILAAQMSVSQQLPVRRVVLTCTFTRARWTALQWVVRLTRLSPRILYRLTSPLTIALSCGPVGDGRRHPAFAASRNSDKDAIARRTAWQIGHDFSDDLAGIQAPLLILMGQKDRFVPHAGREIAKLHALLAERPAAQVLAIANAGHIFLPSAAIDEASERIEAFLQ